MKKQQQKRQQTNITILLRKVAKVNSKETMIIFTGMQMLMETKSLPL